MKLPKFYRQGRPLRIAMGRIFHEANAFSPLTTERTDFERMHLMSGEELRQACTMRGVELKSFMPHAELTGATQAARAAGQVRVIPLLSALAVPNGPLSRSCFDGLVDDLILRAKAALPLDGVYLALHGSMQVHDLDEAPEAYILRRLGEAVGSDVRLAVSYDLHANLSAGMVDPVDVLIAYRTNPHWDLFPTGYRAMNRLIGVLRGRLAPTSAWRKLPMVLGGGTTIDFAQPMRQVFRFMKELERDPKVISASLFMVHPYTNAEQIGWAVHISTDADQALAERLADKLADRAWQQKDVPLPPMLSIEEALAQAKDSLLSRVGPVTLVDVDDIVGAGAPGGNTHLVLGALKSDLRGLIPVHDPVLVTELWDAPEGSKRRVTLRGTAGYDMPEVSLEGSVGKRADGDFGRVVLFEAGALSIAICASPPLPIHPSFWRDLGKDPRKADFLVQKNFFHYRMFYALISFVHLPVVSAGATSFVRIRDQKYPLPMHPGSLVNDWRSSDPLLRRGKRAATATAPQIRP